MNTKLGDRAASAPILHVITSTQRRGAELVAWNVVQRLDGEHEIFALAPAGTPPVLAVPTLGPTPLAVGTLLRLRRRAASASVVVAHGSRTLPACVLALAGRQTRLVYVNIGDPRYWSGSPGRRLRLRLLYRRVNRVALLTRGAHPVFEHDFGVPRERLSVVGSGRSLTAYPPADPATRAEARRALGIASGRRTVAYLGALSPEKRVDVLIDAVASLPDVDLVVAGDGPLRNILEIQARHRLGSRARFVGGRDDPLTVLRAADVLGLTSDTEGLPGVCIEAGLVGIPVVATDVGFTPDIVLHGRTGFLVRTGDPVGTARALQAALDSAAQLGAAGREHCTARFDLEDVVRRWQSLLHELSGQDDRSSTRTPGTAPSRVDEPK